MKNQRRDATLDNFRAISIIVVMLFHYLVAWAPPFETQNYYGYSHTFTPYFALGKLGVETFFVLSGLFITVTAIRSLDAVDFIYRRMSRIYPALLISIAVTYIFISLFGMAVFDISPVNVISSMLLIVPYSKFVDGAYWSLAVEVKFYLWVALLLWVFRQNLWLGMILLQIVGWLVGLVSFKLGKGMFLAPYIPFFLCGSALAYHAFLTRPQVAKVLYVCSALFFLLQWSANPVDFVPLWLSNGVIIAAVGLIVVITTLRLRVAVPGLARLGLVSYEVYLVHQNIGITLINAMTTKAGIPDLVAVLLTSLIVYAMAEAVHWLSERVRMRLNGWYQVLRLKPNAAG